MIEIDNYYSSYISLGYMIEESFIFYFVADCFILDWFLLIYPSFEHAENISIS